MLQPFMNPYYQPMPNYAPVTPGVKTVNSFDEITANDVSMQTPYSVFVRADLTECQVRRWNSNGQIEVIGYSRNAEITPEPVKDSLTSELSEIKKQNEQILSILRRGNEPKHNNSNNASKQSANAE